MIHFKNHKNGFTLIEAMLSIVIIGIVLGPIFMLHGTLMQRVNKASHQMTAFLKAKKFLYDARKQQDPSVQEFTLSYNAPEDALKGEYVLERGVNPKSVLAPYTSLHKESVSLSWTDHQGIVHLQKIVTYVYKKPEQKKS